MLAQKITFDLMQSKLDDIRVVQGDSCREIQFEGSDLDGVLSYDDYTYEFDLMKSDGTFIIQTMSAGVLIPTEQMEVITGTHYYSVKIKDADNELVYSGQGAFIVDDNVITEEAIESVAEVNGLIFPDDFLTVNDHVTFIDDDTVSEDSTWSSHKIQEEIDNNTHVISKTASGNPIEISDAASAPLVKCVTAIQGSQDLHGYDKPWVGGAGKNKLPMTVSEIKTLNTSGTWNGNSYTYNGVTFTVQTDADNNVIGVTTSNTATTDSYMMLYDSSFPSGSYVVNGCPIGGSADKYFINVTSGVNYRDYGSGANVSITNSASVWVQIKSGYGDGLTFYPMLRLSTETDPTFAPYSNICPITAYTEGEIEVSDGDGNTTTHTTTFPSAIYRGSEDVVNGEVTSEWKKVVFDGTEQWTLTSYNIFSLAISDIKNPETAADRRTGIVSSWFPVSSGTAIWDSMDDKSMLKNDGKIFIRNTDCATVADFQAFIVGAELVYELATPTTSSVTTTNLPIKSLNGYTHIESSTGDMEVEYITEPYQPLIDSIAQLI